MPDPETLDYANAGIGTPRKPSRISATTGCLLSIGIALLLCVVIAVALWLHGRSIDRREMREDLSRLGLSSYDDARYEIRRVFSGSASKFYRVKASPAAAKQLIEHFHDGAPTVVRGSVDATVESPEPSWWNPRQLKDASEFDSRSFDASGAAWTRERYWISPSTGWVYVYVVGH